MRLKILWVVVVAGLSACDSGSSVKVTADPDATLVNGMTARQTSKARQLNFKDLGGAYKTINDVLKLDQPDLTAIQLAAKDIKYASDDLLMWFPEGSGPETGLEMESLPAIWGEWEAFIKTANNFRTEAAAFNDVAKAGDLTVIAAQIKKVGGQCKACHDTYRLDD